VSCEIFAASAVVSDHPPGCQTDGIIWVVDSVDKRRLEDCRSELDQLLLEEVCSQSRST